MPLLPSSYRTPAPPAPTHPCPEQNHCGDEAQGPLLSQPARREPTDHQTQAAEKIGDAHTAVVAVFACNEAHPSQGWCHRPRAVAQGTQWVCPLLPSWLEDVTLWSLNGQQPRRFNNSSQKQLYIYNRASELGTLSPFPFQGLI